MDLSLTVADQSVWLPGVAALGVAVGVVAGMFGVGGGFLLVPLMHVVLEIPIEQAVGASLCAIIATATGALLRFRKLGHAEMRFDVMLLGGSVLGADAGTRVLALLEDTGAVTLAGREVPALALVVTGLYTVVFAITIALLWFKRAPERVEPDHVGPLARVRVPPYARLPVAEIPRVSGIVIGYIGFANGLLGGLVGIGGGICLIPIMLYGFGFSIRKTAGTAITVVLAVAIVGTIQHARLGHVHLGLAATLMVGSAVAAQLGATLTEVLAERALRRSLAIVMIVTLVALNAKLLA